MLKNIDHLITKLEDGKTTAQEIESINQWIDEQVVNEPAFDTFKNANTNSTLSKSVMDMVALNDEQYLNELLDAFENDQTTQEETNWVNQYLDNLSTDVDDNYLQYNTLFKTQKSRPFSEASYSEEETSLEIEDLPAIYSDYIQIFRKTTFAKAIDVNKLTSDSSTDENDSVISLEQLQSSAADAPIEYNDYVKVFKLQNSDLDFNNVSKILEPVTEKNDAKRISITKYAWRAVAAVAVFAIGFFVVQQMDINPSNQMAYTQTIQIDDPEEALQLTLSALGAAGKNLDIGNQEIQKIKGVQKSDIFK